MGAIYWWNHGNDNSKENNGSSENEQVVVEELLLGIMLHYNDKKLEYPNIFFKFYLYKQIIAINSIPSVMVPLIE